MASRSRKAKKQARQTKKKKGDSNCEICVVCDKEINDDTEDSIFCEGECQGWIHRVCAGTNSVRIMSFMRLGFLMVTGFNLVSS